MGNWMNRLGKQGAASSSGAEAASSRAFNAVDRAMLSVEQALRSFGSPGFETQIFVWLDGRADVDRLRIGVARLSRRYPVTTARLTEKRSVACWQFRPGAECPLHEADLGSAGEKDVLAFAARLLSTPEPLEQRDPIQFHLLHRAGGRDVFLVQYNHTLMDNNAAVLLLQELERLSHPEFDGGLDSQTENEDLINEYLRRFSRWSRLRAVGYALNRRLRALRERPLLLREPLERNEGAPQLQIATRSLSHDETRTFKSRVIRTCGFPSLSMALLASVFRGVAVLSNSPRRQSSFDLIAGLGVDLGMRRQDGPIFRNLMSIIPIHVPSDKVDDRDTLVRELNREFRELLSNNLDVGALQLTSLLCRRPRRIVPRLRRLMQTGYSLWYAYFGTADAVGPRFCGATVENVFYTASAWSPPGLMFVANQFGERLQLQATYIPALIPASLADELLDWVVRDLVAGEAASSRPSRSHASAKVRRGVR